MRGAILVAALAIMVLCVGGCGSASTSRTSAGQRGVTQMGPLAGLTWPAGKVHAGMLLHDDGRRLWAVPLDGGRPELLWTHPRISLGDIAAAPDGRMLAYAVGSTNPSPTAKSISGFLYLLEADGSIRTVDVVRGDVGEQSPIFLREPAKPKGPMHLYWIRLSQNVRRNDNRLGTQVMVLTNQGPRQVRVPLRYAEAPFRIDGYPGSAMFSLTVFRTLNVPTRLEVLTTNDWTQSATDVSLTKWGILGYPIETDTLAGVAWLNAIDRVVYVDQRLHRDQDSIRVYRYWCEASGSKVIHRGSDIDHSYSEDPWYMLTVGRNRVLVLGEKAVAAVYSHKARTAPWLALDTRSGVLTHTGAHWAPEGWYTYVLPGLARNEPPYSDRHPQADCQKFDTYP